MPRDSRPNIVLILVDDMGYADIGCYGSGTQTPNLDGLAANGVRFTDFYCTPRCCPSRASIMTGLTPHKAGVGWMNFDWPEALDPEADGYTGTLNPHCVTIPEALKPAGYRSYISGKWHLTAAMEDKTTWPTARGFDRSFSCIAGGTTYFKPQFLTLDERFYRPPEQCYATDLIGDFSAQFVSEHFHSHAEQPFFMYVAYTAPHFPIQAPPERVAAYKGRFDHGYEEENRQRYERMVRLGVVKPEWERAPKPARVPAWNDLPEQEQQRLARVMETYAAMVEIMDENVGKLVAALEEHGALDNTLIMFLSDNGACAEGGVTSKDHIIGQDWAYVQNTPFRLYKHHTTQGGVQTAFIAHWPDGIAREKGSTVDGSTGALHDIMPTCLELAGARYPTTHNGHAIHPLDGQSLVPVLAGDDFHDRRDVFMEHEGNGMLRRGDYKLVQQFGEPWQLYDMVKDRSESRDLARETEQRDRFVHMMRDYRSWADTSHVLPGARTTAYMRIHGYGTHSYREPFLHAAENAAEDEVVQG